MGRELLVKVVSQRSCFFSLPRKPNTLHPPHVLIEETEARNFKGSQKARESHPFYIAAIDSSVLLGASSSSSSSYNSITPSLVSTNWVRIHRWSLDGGSSSSSSFSMWLSGRIIICCQSKQEFLAKTKYTCRS